MSSFALTWSIMPLTERPGYKTKTASISKCNEQEMHEYMGITKINNSWKHFYFRQIHKKAFAFDH